MMQMERSNVPSKRLDNFLIDICYIGIMINKVRY